jgi:hypothetical protein
MRHYEIHAITVATRFSGLKSRLAPRQTPDRIF